MTSLQFQLPRQPPKLKRTARILHWPTSNGRSQGCSWICRDWAETLTYGSFTNDLAVASAICRLLHFLIFTLAKIHPARSIFRSKSPGSTHSTDCQPIGIGRPLEPHRVGHGSALGDRNNPGLDSASRDLATRLRAFHGRKLAMFDRRDFSCSACVSSACFLARSASL